MMVTEKTQVDIRAGDVIDVEPAGPVVEVTATPVTHEPDPLGLDQDPASAAAPESITARYAGVAPAAALAAFATAYPDVAAAVALADGTWTLTAVTPGVGDAPERRRQNWERDPDVEVGEGWLSNMAASANNLADALRYEPRYCTQPTRVTPCPGCDAPLALREGAWGPYYHCGCGWKAGYRTGKARTARAGVRITDWCGTRLVARINNLGVPYAGCPTCDLDYRSPSLRDLYA